MSWRIYLKLSFINLILVLLSGSFLPAIFSGRLPLLVFTFNLALFAHMSRKGSASPDLAFFSAFIGGFLLDISTGSLLGMTSLFLVAALAFASLVQAHLVDVFFILYPICVLIFSFLWGFLLWDFGGGDLSGVAFYFIVLNFIFFVVFYLIIGRLSLTYAPESL